jgi:signal transduction histidine kinase
MIPRSKPLPSGAATVRQALSSVWKTTSSGINHLERHLPARPAESKIPEQRPQPVHRAGTAKETFFHPSPITLVVLLLSLVFALLISRMAQCSISRPVVQLARTVLTVSQDKDYSVRAAATGHDYEVSTLIDAFNEMLAQIQKQDAALEQAHDKLEQRVEERTIQLAVANKELELKNREVERATKLKSQFLASMSHELRTPLNAIIGFSDLLADKGAGPLTDKQSRFVGHVRSGASHLLQLINDVLDLSKIEAGQLDMHLEDFQVKGALPEVLSTIAPLAMSKNIKIEQNLDFGRSSSRRPRTLQADSL